MTERPRPDTTHPDAPVPRPLDDRGLPPDYRLDPDLELSPRQLKHRLGQGDDLVLLDCRTPREFAIARIEGALLLPLQTLPQQIGQLDTFADREIVTLCHHGIRSLKAAHLLRRAGFTSVRSLAGGLDAWSLAIDPTVPRY